MFQIFSDVIDPLYYCCCIYWPDVIVPIYFVLYLFVHDVKELSGH